MSEVLNRTFVYENIEVRLTGRMAQKAGLPGKAPITLVEVTPVNEYDGVWKKWPMKTALFDIIETTTK